jgi:hypothetical protein
MIDRERLFPSPFLNASNFPAPKGAVFEIENVRMGPVGREREEKLLVDLVGVGKPLVVNRTNLDTFCSLFGHEEDDWVGQAILLKVAPSKFNGTPSIIASAPTKTAPKWTRSRGPGRREPEPEPSAEVADETPPTDEDWEALND